MARIDADGHVMEPDEMFDRYVPSNISVRWRGVTDVSVNRINIVDRPDADEWVLADEPGADRYASARARGFDNVSTIEMLDDEGFTAAALYPSKFLYLPFANGVGADVRVRARSRRTTNGSRTIARSIRSGSCTSRRSRFSMWTPRVARPSGLAPNSARSR